MSASSLASSCPVPPRGAMSVRLPIMRPSPQLEPEVAALGAARLHLPERGKDSYAAARRRAAVRLAMVATGGVSRCGWG